MPEVQALYDRLQGQENDRGLYAMFRGIDIVGAELSTLYPDGLRLVHATIADLLNRNESAPQDCIEKIAGTLERMRTVSHAEVESVLVSITDRAARERLRKQMAAHRAGKNAAALNIGTLASVGGQDFYLRAMAEPHLRALIADLMEMLISSRSLGVFVSKLIRRLREALAASGAA